MIEEAIILAGGKGTRLQSVVSDVPKPMAQINEKPFLYYLMDYLISQGINHIILSTGYKHSVISNYFGSQFKSAKIEYSVEVEPLGTGGGILKALHLTKTSDILVLNGDTFFPIPIENLKVIHKVNQSEITIALRKESSSGRYGTVCINKENKVTAFEEKKEQASGIINGGIYLINRKIFINRNFPERFSLEKDYLEQIVDEQCISGSVFNNYFIDIGIPESYNQAKSDFLKFSGFENQNN